MVGEYNTNKEEEWPSLGIHGLSRPQQGVPKIWFSLAQHDVLIDLTFGYGMLSLMDGFSGYNQIKMSEKDVEKTAFKTTFGNFYYTGMPFELKNAVMT